MENKLTNLNDIIEQISVIYRGRRNLACELQRELFEISDKLESEKNTIKHIEYLNLKSRLDYVQQEIRIQNYIADGIDLAREEVFKFCKNNNK
ncbi:hypothetical protein ACR77J_07760 [Tissierella praeacuta]|uniref:hypothetical protein n=1 Tax=Tissierella praeacuta TaxID=43131 RepID=UPI003DA4ADD4